MIAAALLAAIALPALLGVLQAIPSLRPLARPLVPLAALPALATALFAPQGLIVPVPWFLFGAILGLDERQRVFLLFTALLWTTAAFYARDYLQDDPQRTRFFAFFLVTMTGNLGLVLSADLAAFYFFFALMSFAAYGLVVHEESAEARRAGRVYILLVMLGEAFLLPSLWYVGVNAPALDLATAAATLAALPERDLLVAGLLLGFGIKAGVLPLHVWLPLAHPVAPTPASAVLSGCMIKAGLLGWLHFLPLGMEALPGWSGLVQAMGLAAAFYGVVLGLAQDRPKTLLAYSSISQMGLITTAVGLGLASPQAWQAATPAILLYACHHALAKGALFLGVGVVESAGRPWRRSALLALTLPALALAGAPPTSGALAKTALKSAALLAPGGWPARLDLLLPLAAVGTTLLMVRFLVLMAAGPAADRTGHAHGLWRPWLVLLLAVALLPWLLPQVDTELAGRTLAPAHLLAALWPVLAGIGLAALVRRIGPGPLDRLRLPAGDILLPLEWLSRRLAPPLARAGARLAVRRTGLGLPQPLRQIALRLPRGAAAVEMALSRPPVVVAILALLALAFLAPALLAPF